MRDPKRDRAPQTDLEREGLAAEEMQLASISEVDLLMLVPNSVNPHAEPTHEPVMPSEVFYNKMALDEDFDMPDGPSIIS